MNKENRIIVTHELVVNIVNDIYINVKLFSSLTTQLNSNTDLVVNLMYLYTTLCATTVGVGFVT